MTTRSRYDELHDRFDPIKTGKAGTRYERLAAMVLKALHERDVVIHDLKLRGDSDVPHQIDVSIARGGIDRRILVECKDFDIRGAKVGLDIVRSFRSVLEDTGADEGYIITCVDFTRHARKYAKAKGIKLAILREFEPKDMEGRFNRIVHTVHLRGAISLTIDAFVFDQTNLTAFDAQLAAAGLDHGISLDTPVAFAKDGENVQFNDFLLAAANKDARDKLAGEQTMRLMPDGWRISIQGGASITFEYADIRYMLVDETEISVITSDRVAEMLLTGFADKDLVIFGDHLLRHRIGPDGEVI